MRRRFFWICILYLLLFLSIAYWGAWHDLNVNGEIDFSNIPSLMNSIVKSLLYLLQWVLPYWWLVIVGSTFILSAITMALTRIMSHPKKVDTFMG